MTAFGIQVDLATKSFGPLQGVGGDLLPILVVGQKHAVVLTPPSLVAIGPVGTGQVQNFPQGYHFIRFGDRLTGILADEEMGPLFFQRCLKILPTRLRFTHLFEEILHHEGEILRRCTHGAAASIAKRHVAGSQNAFGPLLAGP